MKSLFRQHSLSFYNHSHPWGCWLSLYQTAWDGCLFSPDVVEVTWTLKSDRFGSKFFCFLIVVWLGTHYITPICNSFFICKRGKSVLFESWKVKVLATKLCDSVASWTVACQAPLSIEFSRQEYWSGLPFPSPWDLPNPGSHPGFLHCWQILYHLRIGGKIKTIQQSKWCIPCTQLTTLVPLRILPLLPLWSLIMSVFDDHFLL